MSARQSLSTTPPTSSALHRSIRTNRSHNSTGVRAESLRAMNMSLVLRAVLAQPGNTTRAAIAQDTGITRATISRLVDDLISAGFIFELEPATDNQRGRPANRLTPTPGRVVAMGLDVNVGSMSAVLVDLTGQILQQIQIDGDNANTNPTVTMTALAQAAQELLDNSLPEGAIFLGSALALPGLVSPTALALAPNLGWRDISLEKLLQPLTPLTPHVVANEADLAAFAVANPLPGVPSGPSTFIYVSGEVGVGAGLVIDHQLLGGASGWSGEIGHICVDPAGPLCSCGASGCLEAYLGLRSLAAHAGLKRGATTLDVLNAASQGNQAARTTLDEAGAALGRALSAVINSTDIPLVLLGGKIVDLSEAIMEPARRELAVRVLQSSWSQPRIEPIVNSRFLSAIGGAHQVLQSLADNPIPWMSVSE